MVWSTRHQDSKLIDVCTGAAARGGAAAWLWTRGAAARLSVPAVPRGPRAQEGLRHASVRTVSCCACVSGVPAGCLRDLLTGASPCRPILALPAIPVSQPTRWASSRSRSASTRTRCTLRYEQLPAPARPSLACARAVSVCARGVGSAVLRGAAACGHLEPLLAAFSVLCTRRLLLSLPSAPLRPLCVAPLAAGARSGSAACCIRTRLRRSAPTPHPGDARCCKVGNGQRRRETAVEMPCRRPFRLGQRPLGTPSKDVQRLGIFSGRGVR